MLPGWWPGINDGQVQKPCILPERWEYELRNAGFVETEVITDNPESPLQMVLSTKAEPSTKSSIIGELTFLVSEIAADGWVRTVEERFMSKSFTVNWATLDDPPPKDQCIVSLLDVRRPVLDNMSKETYLRVQNYLEQTQGGQILWVTHATQLTCENPRFGYIHGFARTLRHEKELDISIFEIDTWDEAAANALVNVYKKTRKTRYLSHSDPEYEFVLRKGVVHIGRYHWCTLPEQLSVSLSEQSPIKLDIASYGRLDTLQWVPLQEPPLKSGELEVNLQYVGLNFRVRTPNIYAVSLVSGYADCGT